MKKDFAILFCLIISVSLYGQSDTAAGYKAHNVMLEIYPSPLYTVINFFDDGYFKHKGFYSIPFKSRLLYGFNDQIKLGFGIEEKVLFSTARHSQWFITSDYNLTNRTNSSLSITTEAGLYSYLSDETHKAYRGMAGNYYNGIFLRAGITWRKRISKKLFGILFMAYENNLNNKLTPPDDWHLSFKLGLGINTPSIVKNKKDTIGSIKAGIAISFLNNILGRKNDVIIIPFDKNGNKINEDVMFKNNMFFLGRITPGIEFSLNSKKTSFHSLGVYYNKTYFSQKIKYGDMSHEAYDINNIGVHYDYAYNLFKKKAIHSILPYIGARANFSSKEICYTNYSHSSGIQVTLEESYQEKLQSIFIQLLLGGKLINKKYFLDTGFALNIAGVANGTYNYNYKFYDIPFPPKEFTREGKYQSFSHIDKLFKEKYFTKDIYLKIGYNF